MIVGQHIGREVREDQRDQGQHECRGGERNGEVIDDGVHVQPEEQPPLLRDGVLPGFHQLSGDPAGRADVADLSRLGHVAARPAPHELCHDVLRPPAYACFLTASSARPTSGFSMLMNSMGNMNFVAPPFPSASACRNTAASSSSHPPSSPVPKIFSSARAKPSARRIGGLAISLRLEDGRLLLPLRHEDRRRALSLALDDHCPADRFPRTSAGSWRPGCPWAGTISRISTLVTFTPQRSVTSSSFVRRIRLMSSRFARTSSSGMSPITARSVVVAIPWLAPAKFADLDHRRGRDPCTRQ